MGLFDSQNTTRTRVQPYIKDLTKDIFRQATKDFRRGRGGTPYTGSLVTPFHSTSMNAFGLNEDGTPTGGGMLGLAAANSNGQGMSGHLNTILENGGFNPGQMESMGVTKALRDNPGLAELINGNGLTGDQNTAFDALKGTVYGNNADFQNTFDKGGLTDDQLDVADFYRGDMNEVFDPDTIPGYSHVRSRTLDAGANAVAGQAAKMGRLGGAANQGILARTQMDTAAGMDTAEYDKWRARRTAGAGGLAGISQTGQANQLAINSAQQAGLGAVSDMGQRGVDNRNNAISLKSDLNNNLFNAQASGLDRLGQAYGTAMQPYQTERAVGAEMEDLYSRQLADQKRIHDESDSLNRYQKFLGLTTGQPTSSTTTTSPSLAQLLAGGGLAALSLPTLMNWGKPATGIGPA